MVKQIYDISIDDDTNTVIIFQTRNSDTIYYKCEIKNFLCKIINLNLSTIC